MRCPDVQSRSLYLLPSLHDQTQLLATTEPEALDTAANLGARGNRVFLMRPEIFVREDSKAVPHGCGPTLGHVCEAGAGEKA